MPYTIEWRRQGLIWRFEGVVTSEEALQSNQELYGDDRFDLARYQVADFSAVERIEFTPSVVKQIAYLDRAAAISNPRLKVAIVASPEILEEYMKVYEAYAPATQWKVRLCETRDDAEAWLREEGCSLD
jgi:hypothetical protein